MKRFVIWSLCTLAVVMNSATGGAAPPTKEECIQADTDGQSLRMTAKLRAARERFALCASPACPGMVRDDCAQRIDEVQRVMPTIVFDVRDPDGVALANVEVVMDGQTLVDHLAGTAVAVDPGMHMFVFDVAGRASVHQSLLVHEGEKDVRLRVTAGAAPLPATRPAPPVTPQQAPIEASAAPAAGTEGPAGSSRRKLGLIVGAGGVAAVAVGTVTGLMAFASYSSQRNNCSMSTLQECPNHGQATSDHGTAVAEATVSTIAFVLGGAALAGGAYLFFSAPRGDAQPAIGLSPSVGPGSGGVTLHGIF